MIAKNTQLKTIFKEVENYNNLKEYTYNGSDRKMNIWFEYDRYTMEKFYTYKSFMKYVKDQFSDEIVARIKKPLLAEYNENEKAFEIMFDYTCFTYSSDQGWHFESNTFKFTLTIQFER